jgi:arylsulfatase A-like enzyme
VSFTNAISNYPVCSPYRAIVMTGRWPHQQKVLDDAYPGVVDNSIPLDPQQMTLGHAFRDVGYATAYIGKWHLGGTRAEPFGFDHSLIWSRTGRHWDRSFYHPKEGEPVTPKGYNATLMTDQAIDFIEAHQEQPFFLMVSWNPPHSSFTDAPEEKKALYPEGSLPQRPNADLGGIEDEKQRTKIWNQNGWVPFQGYHAHVSAIDDELGRLMDKVDELGLAEDTIIIYTSDHGTMFGSQGIGGKRQPYEESIRTPFVLRWPGVVPPAVKSASLFGAIDVMPTLCALAGIGVPETCVGVDFSPTLCGKDGPEPESQFIMHIAKQNASGGENHPAPIFRGVRTARYTYAVYPDRAWCLFDNQADPYQQKNLIDAPELAEVRAKLDGMVRDWLKKTDDPFEMPT